MIHQSAFFPVTHERKAPGGACEITLGLELSNLLIAELTLSNLSFGRPTSAAEIETYLFTHLHRNRTAFALAISRWPSSVSLELHRTILPDLRHRFHGTVYHYLLLRARAGTREQATELALQHFMTLQGLLNSCFPEAEFSAIASREYLAALCMPFEPGHAIMVAHDCQSINLAEPLLNKQTGFNVDLAGVLSDSRPRSLEKDHTCPWVPTRDSHERMLQFLLWHIHPVWIVVRMCAAEQGTATAERQRLVRLIEQCDDYVNGTIASKTVHKQQVKLLQAQSLQRLATLREGALQLAVLIFTPDCPDPGLPTMVGASISETMGKSGPESLLQGGFSCEAVNCKETLDPRWFRDAEIYTPEEAGAAFRLPNPPAKELPGVPIKRFRSAFANTPQEFNGLPDSILLGINSHRGVRQPVYCRLQDRMRHMFILGMTGTGKSSFMESLVMQDILNGSGLCLVDPHGELVENILPKIPRERERDVLLIDPLDTNHPVGFNLLEWKTIEERDLIIDDLYQSMDRMYDLRLTGGPIFESNYRNMLKLLMGDQPRPGFTPTIVEFPALYLNENFRQWLARTTQEPTVQDFLKELERTGGDASLQNLAPYITSKFSRFSNDTILKRMVGQGHTPFDFREIMDKGRIVLIKLGKGRFGPIASGLLSAQIVSRFRNAAMSRADIPEHERRPFFLYVDEFQNLPRDNFTELLAEARKYRLGLILANQFASQLDRQHMGQESILHALLGNVGTFVLFRLGITDAKELDKIFHPTFSERDLKELPNWQAYVQLHMEGTVLTPFNIETIPDKTPSNHKMASRIVEICRGKYGRPAQEVDAEVNDRRRFFDKETRP